MAKKSLEKWIDEALVARVDDVQCSHMSLMHLRGSSPVEIHTIKFVQGTDYNPVSMAQTFTGKMETDAQNLVGMQEYVIFAYYGTPNPRDRFPMLHDGEGGTKFNGLSTEGPDEKGQTRQSMRLTETIVKGTFGVLSTVQHTQQKFTEEVVEENRKLREENRECLLIIKEAMFEQAKLGHEQRMAELKLQGDLEIKKTMMKALPVLANQLTGKDIFPQSSEDTAIMELLAEHLEPEKVQQFLPMLGVPPAGQGMIMARLARIVKEKREGEERIRQVTAGNTSAELGLPNKSEPEDEAAE